MKAAYSIEAVLTIASLCTSPTSVLARSELWSPFMTFLLVGYRQGLTLRRNILLSMVCLVRHMTLTGCLCEESGHCDVVNEAARREKRSASHFLFPCKLCEFFLAIRPRGTLNSSHRHLQDLIMGSARERKGWCGCTPSLPRKCALDCSHNPLSASTEFSFRVRSQNRER